MPGLDDFKKGFFDKAAVQSKVDAAKRRVLSKFGAFVRQRARTSIRTRKAASRPGQPPSSHVGLLKKFILFAYDQSSESVVVGPALFASAKGQPIPETLEHGGRVPVTQSFFKLSRGLWVSGGSPLLIGKKGGRPSRVTTRTKSIAARPFMRPAEEAERPKFAELWKNAVSK